jgi:hypothetical protein
MYGFNRSILASTETVAGIARQGLSFGEIASPMRPTGATDQLTYYEAWATGQLDYHEAFGLVAAFGAFSGLWCLLFLMGLWGARKGLPLEIEEVIVELNEKALSLIYFLGG